MVATLNVSLSEVKGGALEEIVQQAFLRAFENVRDLNTSPTAKRVIALKITLKPAGDRSAVEVDFELSTKFPGPTPVKTLMIINTDAKGNILGTEPEQATLDYRESN